MGIHGTEHEEIKDIIAENIQNAVDKYKEYGDELLQDIIQQASDEAMLEIRKQTESLDESSIFEASELAEEHGDVYNGEDFHKGAKWYKNRIVKIEEE